MLKVISLLRSKWNEHSLKRTEPVNERIYQHLIPKIPPFSYHTVLAFTSHFRTRPKGKYLAHTFTAMKKNKNKKQTKKTPHTRKNNTPHHHRSLPFGTVETHSVFSICIYAVKDTSAVFHYSGLSLLCHFTEGYHENYEFCIYPTLPKT